MYSPDSLDEDKSGLVSMEVAVKTKSLQSAKFVVKLTTCSYQQEFCKLFEPTIVRRASSSCMLVELFNFTVHELSAVRRGWTF